MASLKSIEDVTEGGMSNFGVYPYLGSSDAVDASKESARGDEARGNQLDCDTCGRPLKDRRNMSCGHVFCGDCLESWADQSASSVDFDRAGRQRMRCPMCQKNAFVQGERSKSFSAVVDKFDKLQIEQIINASPRFGRRVEAPNLLCNICKKGDEFKPATHYCVQCNKNLCATCNSRHSSKGMFQSHNIIETSLVQGNLLCRDHTGEQIQYFCEDCAKVLCTVCTLQSEHHDHKQTSLDQGMKKYRTNLRELITRLEDTEAAVARKAAQLSHVQPALRRAHDEAKDAIMAKAAHVQARLRDAEQRIRGELGKKHKRQRDLCGALSQEDTFQHNACQLLFDYSKAIVDAAHDKTLQEVTFRADEQLTEVAERESALYAEIKTKFEEQTAGVESLTDNLELLSKAVDELLRTVTRTADTEDTLKLLTLHDDLMQRAQVIFDQNVVEQDIVGSVLVFESSAVHERLGVLQEYELRDYLGADADSIFAPPEYEPCSTDDETSEKPKNRKRRHTKQCKVM